MLPFSPLPLQGTSGLRRRCADGLPAPWLEGGKPPQKRSSVFCCTEHTRQISASTLSQLAISQFAGYSFVSGDIDAPPCAFKTGLSQGWGVSLRPLFRVQMNLSTTPNRRMTTSIQALDLVEQDPHRAECIVL